MGASSLSFACATWTETLADWTDAHVQAFAAFGGAPRLLVPDNAKVAVIKAFLYDPQVNRSYAEMARSEEHTSELQSLMRISYAFFCLKKTTEFYAVQLLLCDVYTSVFYA